MSSGGLESVGDDLFQPLTKISTTKEFELWSDLTLANVIQAGI
jgi:hypothetical protein